MVNSQHGSCRSCCATALKSRQVGQPKTAETTGNQMRLWDVKTHIRNANLCVLHCYGVNAASGSSTGVSDVEEAQAGLDFAKRFEIIKGSEVKNIRLQAVDLSDASAIADALPRCFSICFGLPVPVFLIYICQIPIWVLHGTLSTASCCLHQHKPHS